MRLNRLHLRNFRQHLDTVIDFHTGLTGIIGPNGSGKTTILEAIAWSLYGMPAARGTREGIRSLRAPARAAVRVDLDFDLAGHRYHVSRSLTSAELYLDSASAPIANTISGVTDLIRRRMGMSQQEFFHTYFTGQKELSVMASMGPAERAQFLSRVLGYERLRGAQVLVRERRNVIKGEATGLQSAMPESDVVARQLNEADLRLTQAQARAKAALDKLKKTTDRLDKLKPRWEEAQRERQTLQEIAKERAVHESEEAAFERDAKRLTDALAEITVARAEIAQIAAELHVHTDLAAQLVEMDRLAREEGRRRQLLQEAQLLETDLVRLGEQATTLESAAAQKADAEKRRDATRGELDAAAAQLEAARTDWVRDKQEAETKYQERRSHYKEVQQQRNHITDLGPESPCPICTRPLADHFREVLDDLDGKLTEIEVEGRYFGARVEQLATMPDPVRELDERVRELMERNTRESEAVVELDRRAEHHRRLEHDITEKLTRLQTVTADLATIPPGYHVTEHARVRQRHSQFSAMVARSDRLGALTEKEPQLQKQLKAAQVKLEKSRARLKELKERQKASKFSEEKFAELRASHDALVAELRTAELDGLGAQKELEAAQEVRSAADRLRKELERVQDRLRELTVDRRLHEELDRAFTDMRADLNQQLRPEISELASGFLADLTDGRYSELELDDEYNIIVLEDGIPKPVISGGEEDLANLVLRLAISQMIAERAGQSFSLLILDEVFGSLDEARRHNVVELLRRLHDRFEQVVLITHIESVREGLDRVVAVKYDEDTGASRVEQLSAADDDEAANAEYLAAAGGA
jgi:DNA repair protein SbcC/Rad50